MTINMIQEVEEYKEDKAMYELIGFVEGEMMEVLQTKEAKDLDLHLRLVYDNGTVKVTFRPKKDKTYHINTKDRRI